MSCEHIGEKNRQPIDANTQRPLWLERKIGPLDINHNNKSSLA
jgi:hypothetical protein